MPQTFVFKPQPINASKGPVFLAPSEGPRDPPVLILADGRRITGTFYNSHEGRHQWTFPKDILGQQGAQLVYNGQTAAIANTNSAYEGAGLDSLAARAEGSVGDMSGMFAGGDQSGMMNILNMLGMGLGNAFKDINYKPIKSKPIDYKPVETAPYDFTDPIEAAKRYNDFNKGQEEQAYQTGINRSRELAGLDTSTTMDFANQMSTFQRGMVAEENKFNQGQRLNAVDFAMPDLRPALDAKKGRADTYASGRLLSSAEDRAYELAAKSASADGSFVRGFGDDSVFGKRTSDVLSAQQRLGISQMGEGMLNDWIQQGSSLLIDSPLKSTISQRLPSTPQILPSQIAGQQQNMLTNLNTVPLQFGISSEINQNQYKTNLEQGNRAFNATNEFAEDQFNEGNRLNAAQFNASNTMAKDQFNSSGNFQAAQSQFNALSGNYQLATQAANRAEDIQRQDAHNQAASQAADNNIGAQQSAGNAGAAGQIGGTIVGGIASIAPAIPGIIGAIQGDQAAQPGGSTGSPVTGGQATDGIMGYEPSYTSGGGSGLEADIGNYPTSGIGGGGGGDVGGTPDFSSGGGSGLEADIGTYDTSSIGGGDGMKMLRTSGGAPLTYGGSAIPVQEGTYDTTATAQDISAGMQATGGLISDLGRSGPSTPQLTALGNGIRNGGQAADTITKSYQSATTPEAQGMLTDQLHGAASANAADPESRQAVDEIFGQVKEHFATGVGVNGQAAGIAGFVKNYDQYSGPERVRGITNISFAGQDLEGTYGVKDLTGKSLSQIPVPGTKDKMNVQDAISLSNSGYNVSSLVTNWDDIEGIHGTLNSKGNVLSIASTARNLGLLDTDTPDTINQRQLALRQAGAQPAGAWGAGAVAVSDAQKGQVQKLGMIVTGTTNDGQQIAIPRESAASAGLSTGVIGSGIDDNGASQVASSTLAIGQGTAEVYNSWTRDYVPHKTPQMGAKASVANGLYKLGAKDPYLLGNVLLGGLEKGQVSAETIEASRAASEDMQTSDYKFPLSEAPGWVQELVAMQGGASGVTLPATAQMKPGESLADVASGFQSTAAGAPLKPGEKPTPGIEGAVNAPMPGTPIEKPGASGAIDKPVSDNPLYLKGSTSNFTAAGSPQAPGVERGSGTLNKTDAPKPAKSPTQQQQKPDMQDQNIRAGITGVQAVINSAAKLDVEGAGTAASYVNAGAAGYNLYTVFNDPNSTDKQKAEAVAQATQAGTALAAEAGSETASEALPYLTYAMAAYKVGDILNSDMDEKQKAQAVRRQVETTVANIYSFGLASVAQFADAKWFGGKGEAFKRKTDKYRLDIIVGDKLTTKALQMVGSGKDAGQVQRDGMRAHAQRLGMTDAEHNMDLASGKKFNIGVDGHGGEREWHNPEGRRFDQKGVSKLNAYDIDYTKDLDAVMNVGGVALAALQFGGLDNENARKMGNYYTNGIVSDAGTADLTKDGFNTAQSNLKLQYEKIGVSTKADAYALSNQMLNEGRLTQAQLVTVQQGINLAFDKNGFQAANQLLEGVKLGRKGETTDKPEKSPYASGEKPTSTATPAPAGKPVAKPTAAPIDKPISGVTMPANANLDPGFTDPVLSAQPIKRPVMTANANQVTAPMEIQNG